LRRIIATLLAIVTATAGISIASTASAVAGERVTLRLDRAINALPRAAETRKGYVREKFRHWVDADGDCQDTRDEVLAAESRVKVSGCDIQAGRWRSWYDGVSTTASTGFDIDHMVPLAEAWDSGAKRWNTATRERFANDLRDRRSLVAVTASSNRTKSDRDPAEWMPALHQCRYVRHWVAVKLRWKLKVDRAEKRMLFFLAGGCTNTKISVTRAVVVLGGSGSESDASSGGGGGGGGLDPEFAYCYEVIAAGYGPYYQGQDPEYGWYTDGDSDGIVCE